MKGVLIIGGCIVGKVATYLADSQKQAEVMTGQVRWLEIDQTIHIAGENFQIVGTSPGLSQVLFEQMKRSALRGEARPKSAFGSDRPYLKKKKGRS
jgi:hypothetical protein